MKSKNTEIYQTLRDDARSLARLCFWILALLAMPWIGRLLLYRPWTIDQFQGLLHSIQWQHTVPPALIIALWLYRDHLPEFLKRIRKILGPGGVGLEMSDMIAIQAVQTMNAPESERMTVEDVMIGLGKVEGMNAPLVQEEVERAHSILMAAGISTKTVLRNLLESVAVIKKLRDLYVSELRRNPAVPLDPIGFSSYAPLLFLGRLKDDTVRAVQDNLRRSDEYADRQRAR